MADRDLQIFLRKLGAQVRALRLAQNMSQKKLAFRLRISTYYLRQLERGEANFTMKILQRLASVLKVHVRDLLDS